MSNSLFCCATPRNVTGGVLELVNRTTIHQFCGLAIDIPESRSLTNGVRHQTPRVMSLRVSGRNVRTFPTIASASPHKTIDSDRQEAAGAA